MFALDEKEECEQKQQPILGIWMVLHVFSSARGFQTVRGRKAVNHSLNVLSNLSLPDTAGKGQLGLKFTSQPAGSSRCDPAVSLGAAAAAAKPAAQGFAASAPGNETTARDLPRLYSGPDRVWG